MLKLRNLKVLAMLASMGALLVMGATHTASLASKGTEMSFGSNVCTGPSKVFSFGLEQVGSDRVSALMMRIAPEVALSQLSFRPEPEEILPNRDGLLEMRYRMSDVASSSALEVEVCGGNMIHEVREAYWIARSNIGPLAHMINTDNITWILRDSGEDVVPGTQLETKELSCTGHAVVQQYQYVVKDQPLCITDPDALENIHEEMAKVSQNQTSLMGKMKTVFFGAQGFERQFEALNTAMAKLYLYSPYEGTVKGVSQDQMNGLTWIEMEIEESTNSDILVVE